MKSIKEAEAIQSQKSFHLNLQFTDSNQRSSLSILLFLHTVVHFIAIEQCASDSRYTSERSHKSCRRRSTWRILASCPPSTDEAWQCSKVKRRYLVQVWGINMRQRYPFIIFNNVFAHTGQRGPLAIVDGFDCATFVGFKLTDFAAQPMGGNTYVNKVHDNQSRAKKMIDIPERASRQTLQ